MAGSWTSLALELIGDITSKWIAIWVVGLLTAAALARLVRLVETFWLTPLYLWGLQSLLGLYFVDHITHYWAAQGWFLSNWQHLFFESYCLVLVVSAQCGLLWSLGGRANVRNHFRGTLGWSALLTVGSVLLLINWKFLFYCRWLDWTIQPGLFFRPQ